MTLTHAHPVDMTPAEREECVAILAALPLRELRRRQDLCGQQIRIAYDTSNTRALKNLRCMEHDLMQAVGKVAGLW